MRRMMRNPFGRLKFLPWWVLLQVALMTMAIVLVAEISLMVVMAQSVAAAELVQRVFNSLGGLILNLAIPVGVGALAVVIFERLNRFAINTSTLWGLVLCLIGALLLKSLLIGSILLGLNQISVVCMIVGLFWKGRPYWQWYRRW